MTFSPENELLVVFGNRCYQVLPDRDLAGLSCVGSCLVQEGFPNTKPRWFLRVHLLKLSTVRQGRAWDGRSKRRENRWGNGLGRRL